MTVTSEEEALEAVTADAFDPTREVVLETNVALGIHPQVSESETVTVDRFDERAGTIELTVKTDHPRLVVISQNFHPHWTARIDGQETAIHRANYVWQAVHVPSGTHTVSLTYSDSLAVACRWISLISLVLLIAGSAYFFRTDADLHTRKAA